MASVFTAPLTIVPTKPSLRLTSSQISRSVNLGLAKSKLQNFDNALGRITGKASEFHKSMDAATARVFAFGAAVAIINSVRAAFSKLVSVTIEVQAKLKEVQAVLGGTRSEFLKLSDSIFEVGKKTGQGFKSVATGAAELARQGLSAEENAKRLEAALVLTNISAIDSEKSVKTLTATINGFSESGLNAAEIVNKLVAVDTAFAVSADDLADGLARSASTAQDAGLSFEQLEAIITAVQQRTARGGAVIGNALKTIFPRLTRTDTIQKLQALGVAVDSTQNGIQKLQAIAEAVQSIGDPVTTNKIFELAAGLRQINIVSAIVKDLSSDTSIYADALEIAGDAGNEAFEKNAALVDTLAGKINALTILFTKLGAQIGEITLAPLFDAAISIGEFLGNAFDKSLAKDQGVSLAKVFLDGFRNVLLGPGVFVAALAFAKIFSLVFKFAKEGLKDILKIGTATEVIKNNEVGIVALLQKDNALVKKLASGSLSRAEIQKAILASIQKQNLLLTTQRTLVKDIATFTAQAGLVYSQGVFTKGRRPVGGRGFASGFQADKAMEVSAARSLGASSTVRAHMSKGTIGGKRFMMNSQETEIPNFGQNGDSAVIPHYAKGFSQPISKIDEILNPLSDAISRERLAGVPTSKIRVSSDERLMSKQNPFGLGVTNTADEPRGLQDVFAKGHVPNFVGNNIPALPPLFSKQLNQEAKNLVKGFSDGSISMERLNVVIKNLEKELGKQRAEAVKATAIATRQNATQKALKDPPLPGFDPNIPSRFEGLGTERVPDLNITPKTKTSSFAKNASILGIPQVSDEFTKSASRLSETYGKAQIGGKKFIKSVEELTRTNVQGSDRQKEVNRQVIAYGKSLRRQSGNAGVGGFFRRELDFTGRSNKASKGTGFAQNLPARFAVGAVAQIGVTAGIEKLNKEFNKGAKDVTKYEEQLSLLQSQFADADKGTDAYNKLKDAIKETEDQLNDATAAAKKTNKNYALLNQVAFTGLAFGPELLGLTKKLGSGLRSVFSDAGRATSAFAILSAALVNFAVASNKASLDRRFELAEDNSTGQFFKDSLRATIKEGVGKEGSIGLGRADIENFVKARKIDLNSETLQARLANRSLELTDEFNKLLEKRNNGFKVPTTDFERVRDQIATTLKALNDSFTEEGEARNLLIESINNGTFLVDKNLKDLAEKLSTRSADIDSILKFVISNSQQTGGRGSGAVVQTALQASSFANQAVAARARISTTLSEETIKPITDLLDRNIDTGGGRSVSGDQTIALQAITGLGGNLERLASPEFEGKIIQAFSTSGSRGIRELLRGTLGLFGRTLTPEVQELFDKLVVSLSKDAGLFKQARTGGVDAITGRSLKLQQEAVNLEKDTVKFIADLPQRLATIINKNQGLPSLDAISKIRELEEISTKAFGGKGKTERIQEIVTDEEVQRAFRDNAELLSQALGLSAKEIEELGIRIGSLVSREDFNFTPIIRAATDEKTGIVSQQGAERRLLPAIDKFKSATTPSAVRETELELKRLFAAFSDAPRASKKLREEIEKFFSITTPVGVRTGDNVRIRSAFDESARQNLEPGREISFESERENIKKQLEGLEVILENFKADVGTPLFEEDIRERLKLQLIQVSDNMGDLAETVKELNEDFEKVTGGGSELLQDLLNRVTNLERGAGGG